MNYIILIICFIILPVISLKQVNPKFCINCKYFIPDINTGEFGKCSFFKKKENKIHFLVTNITQEEYYFCSTARDANDMCGEEGKHYKKKES